MPSGEVGTVLPPITVGDAEAFAAVAIRATMASAELQRAKREAAILARRILPLVGQELTDDEAIHRAGQAVLKFMAEVRDGGCG